ncbi:MAG: WD40 repeat domain-containing protein, partial [Planctomycetia bacterium]
DGAVRRWSAAGDLTRDWSSGDGPCRSLAWSPDGERLAAAGVADVRRWKVASPDGPLPKDDAPPLAGGRKPAACVAWRPDGKMLSAGDVTGVRFWNLADGAAAAGFATTKAVVDMAWNPQRLDGTGDAGWRLAVGTTSELLVLETQEKPTVAPVAAPKWATSSVDGLRRLAGSSDGLRLALGVGDADEPRATDGVRVLQVGEKDVRFEGFPGGPVVWDGAGRGVWLCGADAPEVRWFPFDGEPTGLAGVEPLRAVAFQPTAEAGKHTQAAVLGRYGSLATIDPESGEVFRFANKLPGGSIGWTGDGERLAVDHVNSLAWWKADGTALGSVATKTGELGRLGVAGGASADQPWVAFRAARNVVGSHAGDKQTAMETPAFGFVVRGVASAPDGAALAVAGGDGTL